MEPGRNLECGAIIPLEFADAAYRYGHCQIRRLGVTPLSAEQVGLHAIGWTGETPLWYYVLREADVTTSGSRLGPVGARIVAEVIITLLDRDPASVRHADSTWRPRRSLIGLLAPGRAST